MKTPINEKRAVVIGGEVMGCQIGEFLAERGVQVTIVGPQKEIAEDGGNRHKIFTAKRINDNPQMDVYMKAAVESISSDSITIVTGDDRKTLEEIDLFVLAWGTISDRRLLNALLEENKVPELYHIGDCSTPRKTIDAIYEGAEVAYRL